MASTPDMSLSTPAFLPPSIDIAALQAGRSYTHHSAVPSAIARSPTTPTPTTITTETEYVLGIDEAGRGPVLGPMVYAAFYVPRAMQHSLLGPAGFADSKVLTPPTRTRLMQRLCTPSSSPSSSDAPDLTDLHAHCGWATRVLSARDIGAGMLRPAAAGPGAFNLNAQAMEATVALIRGVLGRRVAVKEIYIDTVGPPAAYQRKLAALFPAVAVTVAAKADALYPCVSAASVCAKVTRDAALKACEHDASPVDGDVDGDGGGGCGWGSGYPSDARCSTWLRCTMDPVFGWGNECRFSWSTAKDLLDATAAAAAGAVAVRVEWPVERDDDAAAVAVDITGLMERRPRNEMVAWYGVSVAEDAF
ncbi:MAG: hypothetical protein M1826_002637 [Phylliscum demangeonii]|nr:MAG: hypothetical protein M1826_002637 [Phylliscum demangeonii]